MATLSLPNGDTLTVPDDYTQEQVQAVVDKILKQAPEMPQDKPGFIEGLGYGLEQTGLGVKQGIQQLAGYLPDVLGGAGARQRAAETTKSIEMNRRMYEQMKGEQADNMLPGVATGAVVGEILPSLLLPAGKGIKGVLTMGTLMGASLPTATGESKLQNALTGGAIGGTLGVLGKGTRLLTEKAPSKLYKSGLKMSKTIKPERAEAIAQTGIEGGFMPTRASLEKLDSGIEGLNNQISEIISASAKKGEGIKVKDVATRIDELKPFYENTIAPKTFTDALDAFKDEIVNHPKAVNGILPSDVAQAIKQNTYKLISKHYGEMKGVNIEAQKAVARGIKDELVNMYPQLATLNAKESSLIELNKVLERATRNIDDRNLIPFGAEMAAASGAVVGGGTGAAVGVLGRVLDLPRVKTALAIALNRADKIAKKAPSMSKAKTPIVQQSAISESPYGTFEGNE